MYKYSSVNSRYSQMVAIELCLDFKAFMRDFVDDGVLDMLMRDRADLTANAELASGLARLKHRYPAEFEILREGFVKCGG